jgi:hypothetical protein
VKRNLLILLCIVAGVVAFWRLLLFPSWTFRYRLTIDVAVGDQIKTGSGVIEKTWTDVSRAPFTTNVRWNQQTRGEAIAVDLGSHGRLFALLSPTGRPLPNMERGDALDSLFRALAPVFGRVYKMTDSEMWSYRPPREAVDVPPILVPMLVRFRDINDPKTVEEVDPNNLVASFGPDVKLARATVQMAPAGFWPFNWFNAPFPQWLFGEPITTGIEKQLPPWYAELERSTRLEHKMLALGGGSTMNNAPLGQLIIDILLSKRS